MVLSRNIAAFGSGVERFGRILAHPNLDPSGLYVARPPACDPCRYSPLELSEVFRVNRGKAQHKDPWRYKAEVEEWSQNLGYRNQKVLEYNAYMKSILGPVWHEVTEPGGYQAACRNVGFGRTPRFRRSQSRTPGPGTYYSERPYTAPYGPHSGRPTMEREEPCRFKDNVSKWSLAPNRYVIVDKDSIENKPKKVVSKRGPYELFTGVRDGSSIKNHFNKSMKVQAATWPIALKGTLDKYERSRFGTMNKTGREVAYAGRGALVDAAMCRRRADEPGPAHYPAPAPPPPWPQNKRPFNSSYDKGPGYRRTVVWPGVGRYSPSEQRCDLPGRGHRHVFQSKTEASDGNGRVIACVRRRRRVSRCWRGREEAVWYQLPASVVRRGAELRRKSMRSRKAPARRVSLANRRGDNTRRVPRAHNLHRDLLPTPAAPSPATTRPPARAARSSPSNQTLSPPPRARPPTPHTHFCLLPFWRKRCESGKTAR